MTRIAIAMTVLLTATAAFAQSNQTGGGANAAKIEQPGPARVTPPGTPETGAVKPGGSANSGPGSASTEIRGGTGAENRSNNPGADANAEKPEVAVPNTGGGGGGGGQ